MYEAPMNYSNPVNWHEDEDDEDDFPEPLSEEEIERLLEAGRKRDAKRAAEAPPPKAENLTARGACD
jgi:hypothetical protein